MLKIAAIAAIVLSGIGVLFYLGLGIAVFIAAPMYGEEKDQKAHRKTFWIYTVALFSLLVLTFVLNYLRIK